MNDIARRLKMIYTVTLPKLPNLPNRDGLEYEMALFESVSRFMFENFGELQPSERFAFYRVNGERCALWKKTLLVALITRLVKGGYDGKTVTIEPILDNNADNFNDRVNRFLNQFEINLNKHHDVHLAMIKTVLSNRDTFGVGDDK